MQDDYFEPVQCELKNKQSGELLCVQPSQKPTIVKANLSESDEDVLKKQCMLKNDLIYQTRPIMNFQWLIKTSHILMQYKRNFTYEFKISDISNDRKVVGVRQSTLDQLNKTITYLGKTDQFFKQNQNIRVK